MNGVHVLTNVALTGTAPAAPGGCICGKVATGIAPCTKRVNGIINIVILKSPRDWLNLLTAKVKLCLHVYYAY